LTLSILPIIGRAGCFYLLIDMRLNYEFSFADPAPIHRVVTSNSTQTFLRLKQAHPTLNSVPFLGGRRRLGSTGAR
jgi:hypothetical protein